MCACLVLQKDVQLSSSWASSEAVQVILTLKYLICCLKSCCKAVFSLPTCFWHVKSHSWAVLACDAGAAEEILHAEFLSLNLPVYLLICFLCAAGRPLGDGEHAEGRECPLSVEPCRRYRDNRCLERACPRTGTVWVSAGLVLHSCP